MRLQDYDRTQRHRAKLASSKRMTSEQSSDEVRELVFDVDDAPAFEVGQSIGVLAPADEGFGKKEHFRLYTIADVPEPLNGGCRLKVAVKRVSYIDEFNGERYDGVASNYLCDLDVGDEIRVTGPYGSPFEIPEENDANLILIGMGTGIAPFRAFVKKLYRERPNFEGAVRLFYGAKSGLDFVYMNDEHDDFAQYYDRDTFEAVKAVSPRPHWEDPIAWDEAIERRGEEVWKMLLDHRTYVYLAGLEVIRDQLNRVFASMAESTEKWRRRKAELEAGGRWVELLY